MVLSMCGEGSEKGQWRCLDSGVLSGRKLYPGTQPDARHFTFSLCATGAPQATVPVSDPRGSESKS